MKFTCTHENLNKAINVVSKIINKNTTLPILNNVLLKTDKNGLILNSTNLELGVSYWIGGKVEEEGEITVPTKLFANFISNLPNGNVEIKQNEDILSVKCNGYKTNIKGLSAKEYPIMPKIENKPIFKLNSNEFKHALYQILPAISNSESRMELTGVFVNLSQIKKNILTLAATDSYRLTEKKIKLKKENINEEALNVLGDVSSIIIPRATIQELVRDLDNKEEIIEVIISEKQILFNFGSASMISRLIEGRYPDYKQIIPNEFLVKVEIEKKEILNAIKIASLFASASNNGIQIKIAENSDSLEIIAETSDIGNNTSKIPAIISIKPGFKNAEKESAETQGNDLNIVYNYKYLIDGLNSIDGDKSVLNINGESVPTVLSSSISDDYVYIIMPIRS